jgi:hypothetical protein
MPVEPAGLGVVMSGAGWQIAHCYGKPLEQPFSQRPHPQVRRQPVQDAFLWGGSSATPKTYPRKLPSGVGGKRNGKGSLIATPSRGESRRRFTAFLFRLRLQHPPVALRVNIPAVPRNTRRGLAAEQLSTDMAQEYLG